MIKVEIKFSETNFIQEENIQSYELIRNLFETEEKEFQERNIDYINTGQRNINALMRAILSDWLMEVSSQFGFKRSTYHLSISLLDKFLSIEVNIPTNRFQLVGVTVLIIAAKTEVLL